ncbi:MAG TPA: hypothetical protein DIW47_00685 [Bacteroidetes bacterium]|nr:hypothetical protein [Bacteroidota bacterium]
MPNQPYLPRTDEQKKNWLNNFAAKKNTHQGVFGFTGAEVTSTQQDAIMFAYIIALIFQNREDMKEFTAYKNILRDGPKSAPTTTFPSFTPAGATPTLVAADIFERVARDAERIKAHNNYTPALGQDFGIIGTAIVFDPNALKPALKLGKVIGMGVPIGWKKGVADGVRIEKQIVSSVVAPLAAPPASATWSLLAIDTEPDYLDTTPITAPVTWRYRAIYIIGDEIVGAWSDDVQITVG